MSEHPLSRPGNDRCDYCFRPPTRIHRDSGDLLCDTCARDQVSSPATDLSLIGPRTLAWYRH